MPDHNIKLNASEIGYIVMLVVHDYKERSDQARHALVHGVDYDDPVIDMAANLSAKLERAVYQAALLESGK